MIILLTTQVKSSFIINSCAKFINNTTIQSFNISLYPQTLCIPISASEYCNFNTYRCSLFEKHYGTNWAEYKTELCKFDGFWNIQQHLAESWYQEGRSRNLIESDFNIHRFSSRMKDHSFGKSECCSCTLEFASDKLIDAKCIQEKWRFEREKVCCHSHITKY